jgi:hypothetical protein
LKTRLLGLNAVLSIPEIFASLNAVMPFDSASKSIIFQISACFIKAPFLHKKKPLSKKWQELTTTENR